MPELLLDELLPPEGLELLLGDELRDGVLAREGGGEDRRDSALPEGDGRELGKEASLCGFCGFGVGIFRYGRGELSGCRDERMGRLELDSGLVT